MPTFSGTAIRSLARGAQIFFQGAATFAAVVASGFGFDRTTVRLDATTATFDRSA